MIAVQLLPNSFIFSSSADSSARHLQLLIYAADAATTDNENPRFTLQYHAPESTEIDRTGRDVTAQLIGEHHTTNLLAATTAAFAAGVDFDTIAAAMPRIKPVSAHRMARTDRPDGITILDDAYNANPESMRAEIGRAHV